jgi:hypothetical protein
MSRTTSKVQITNAVPEILGNLPGWTNIAVAEDGHDLRVSAQVGGKPASFRIQMKASASKLDHQQEDGGGSKHKRLPIVLASSYLRPKVRQSLREAQQNYLDTAGNIYLDLPGLYLFRESNDLPLVDDAPKRRSGETFNPTATRVGLHLLLDADLVNAPFRELAAKTGVSLRSVNLAMDAFKADGHVVGSRKAGWRLVQRESFFQRWVEGFNRRLRPKLELGKYSPTSTQTGDTLEVGEGVACWGGDKGATALGMGIHSMESLVYVYGKPAAVIAKNRLRLDPNGTIELLASAWDQSQESKAMVAPVFVVYADLMHAGDPRCEEIAARLFKDVIQDKLDA